MSVVWLKRDDGDDAVTLNIRDAYFADTPIKEGHIYWNSKGVYLSDITIFPGTLTPWGAVKWATLRILRLGTSRVNRIKSFLRIEGRK